MEKKDHEWGEVVCMKPLQVTNTSSRFSERKKNTVNEKKKFRTWIAYDSILLAGTHRNKTKFFNCRQSCDVPCKWECPWVRLFLPERTFLSQITLPSWTLFLEARPRRKHCDVPYHVATIVTQTLATSYIFIDKRELDLQIIFTLFHVNTSRKGIINNQDSIAKRGGEEGVRTNRNFIAVNAQWT